MIRPIAIELALFLTPFALYALFLWATRAGVLHPDAWSTPRLAWLAITALVLMIASFAFVVEFAGAPPNAAYVPPHLENGKLIPGTVK
jgi:hypothetical protein